MDLTCKETLSDEDFVVQPPVLLAKSLLQDSVLFQTEIDNCEYLTDCLRMKYFDGSHEEHKDFASLFKGQSKCSHLGNKYDGNPLNRNETAVGFPGNKKRSAPSNNYQRIAKLSPLCPVGQDFFVGASDCSDYNSIRLDLSIASAEFSIIEPQYSRLTKTEVIGNKISSVESVTDLISLEIPSHSPVKKSKKIRREESSAFSIPLDLSSKLELQESQQYSVHSAFGHEDDFGGIFSPIKDIMKSPNSFCTKQPQHFTF
mmetsp:Transcript_23178/g.30086  ORF Transcript_23178/g.30086 Transcript_23178/m.30086 type:complete len:258 (-) Transcript_23178:222-995(-)